MQNTKTPYVKAADAYKSVAIGFMAIAIYSALTTDAYALAQLAIASNQICTMIGTTMGGGLARAIATIGVIMVGAGATLGKVSWTLAISVAVGIAALFATASIVASLNTAGATGCFGT